MQVYVGPVTALSAQAQEALPLVHGSGGEGLGGGGEGGDGEGGGGEGGGSEGGDITVWQTYLCSIEHLASFHLPRSTSFLPRSTQK